MQVKMQLLYRFSLLGKSNKSYKSGMSWQSLGFRLSILGRDKTDKCKHWMIIALNKYWY